MHGFKKCLKCHEEKGLDMFYRHEHMRDGRVNKCKECARKEATENRKKNIDRVRAYDRARSKNPERIALATEVSRRWRAQDRRRAAAHSAVARAIRAGTLERKPCQRCGEEKSLAHHEDYSNQLEVVWLCQPCHKERHKEMVLAGIDPCE